MTCKKCGGLMIHEIGNSALKPYDYCINCGHREYPEAPVRVEEKKKGRRGPQGSTRGLCWERMRKNRKERFE